jgi:uncharacterized membrane protein YjdF
MEQTMNTLNKVRSDRYPLILLLLLLPVFVWSVISPVDYFTWLLEMLPVVIGWMFGIRRKIWRSVLSAPSFHCCFSVDGTINSYQKMLLQTPDYVSRP